METVGTPSQTENEMIPFSTKNKKEEIRTFQYSIIETTEPLNIYYNKNTSPDEFGKTKTVIEFKVYTIPANNKFYSHKFEIINNPPAISVNMDNNKNDEFKGQGIPERIIEIASCYLRRDIISSKKGTPGAFMSNDSKKVWDRVVSKNPNASFDKVKGHYILKFERPSDPNVTK
jgi:hypothetical protein